MRFSRYNIITILLILGLILTTVILTKMWLSGNRGFAFSGVGVLLVIFITAIYFHLNRMTRMFLQFAEALKNRDISTGFNRDIHDPFLSAIAKEFTEINRDFGLVRRDMELQHHLFSAAINHIQAGILVYRKNGEILLANAFFKTPGWKENIRNIQELGETDSQLTTILGNIKKGEEKVADLMEEGYRKKYSIHCNEFILNEERLKLVSVRDITRQIDRSELEAWQKLIRVLRHEIMNTLSPIRIHASGLISIIRKDEYGEGDMENLVAGLESIRRRAGGLADFVDSYKSFTELPRPEFNKIEWNDFINGIEIFFRDTLKKEKIMLNTKHNPGIVIRGDKKLLEQVFINIINNSTEALKEAPSPEINISAVKSGDNVILRIGDNGRGVDQAEMENIFIPFYTTREAGSGIGLSISRQIIQMHGGTIMAEAGKEKGVVFIIKMEAG